MGVEKDEHPMSDDEKEQLRIQVQIMLRKFGSDRTHLFVKSMLRRGITMSHILVKLESDPENVFYLRLTDSDDDDDDDESD